MSDLPSVNLAPLDREEREALLAILPQRRHRMGQLAQELGVDLQGIKNP
jgi:hypothetical protein